MLDQTRTKNLQPPREEVGVDGLAYEASDAEQPSVSNAKLN